MDTSAAKAEIKKVLKTFRAAEHFDEVLSVAIAAEQNQANLKKECSELETEKVELKKEVSSLSKKFKDAAHKVKADTATFQKQHEAQMERHQAAETASLDSIENAKAVYRGEVSKLQADFKALKEKKEAAIKDLDARAAKAQNLLNDTMEKFRKIA